MINNILIQKMNSLIIGSEITGFIYEYKAVYGPVSDHIQ